MSKKRNRKRARRSRRSRGRKAVYNRRKKVARRSRSRKARRGGRRRKCGAYACFTKKMWSKNRAHYKKIGVGAAARQIAKAWKAKGK